MAQIKIDHVTRKFGKNEVLKDISFELEPNKIYGLLGRNGAGKSTLLNIMTTRIFASSGKVTMDQQSVVENDDILADMFLMSEVDLYPERMRVEKIFKQAELCYGSFDYKKAYKLAEEFGVKLTARFGGLSTGYHSIVKLIVALCVPVNFVFFDEPVLGLDANHRELFYQELLQSYEERPRTFVISTHLIEEIAQIVEHVFILDQGKIVIDDETQAIIDRSYAITGPKKAVSDYSVGLNVIGHQTLGGLRTDYIYGDLDDERVIPDTIKIEHVDLQKLFVYLTEGSVNYVKE
ncbi:ATP-binding cassette domain-containing protein [Paucilactobacillus wasatchensis]|uniref:ABC transporter, ATP-binding protein n=1 Tax=Paucilactobacillus wasatchensis TaxID=1335616 RepID=A0A0D1A956_9LACO|nr:ABC transporter ATP-binding protein [Paucilactobacillus wasatchensis]KIS04227.1 ABC transporter, ATP-binding protein [Paucilactobacillus wasatchensis]